MALFELTLKAAVIANDLESCRQVIVFAHDNKYAIQVDEETVWYAVLQTQIDRPMEGNYDIIRLLVEQEVIYRVKSQNDLGQALDRYLTNDG